MNALPDLFRTAISINNIKGDLPRLSILQPVLSIGSCFAANMVAKLSEHGYVANDSGLGTVFNLQSISEQLLPGGDLLSPQHIVERDGSYVSLMAHSSVYADDKDQLVEKLNYLHNSLSKNLQQAQVLLITLGSAWVYENVSDGITVANCQKLPAKHFNKRLQSVEDLVSIGSDLFRQLAEKCPNLKVVLSVSAVRHLKDGFAENMRSKAHLITAAHLLTEAFEQVYYFPAYEILMDDLRDYRYYDKDMLHPSAVAVDYIWELFFNKCVSEEDRKIAHNFNALYTFLQHKTLVSNQNRAEKIEQMLSKLPVDLPALKLLNLAS